MKYILAILWISTIILSWCSSSKRSGFYYKDKNNIGDESTWIVSKNTFSSKEECVKRAYWIADSTSNTKIFDYECWYKCREENWFSMCDKTEK